MLKSDLECALNTISKKMDTIEKLRDSLDDRLTQALDMMQQAKGRIIITSIGKFSYAREK